MLRQLLLMLVLLGCHKHEDQPPAGPIRLVFKYQPLGNDPAPIHELLASFERENPDLRVRGELLPNSSDLVHQFYLTALEGGDRSFDVLVVDVIWVPSFARAGWIADLSDAFPPQALAHTFLPGPVRAVVASGHTFAVPWYIDAGLLYYRSDLLPRAPRTYHELQTFVATAKARDPTLSGYLWQGRQYEGLSCNVYEAIWGYGGTSMTDGRFALNTPQARAALAWLSGTLRAGISPAQVTSADEQQSRRTFARGHAVLMRNWPYAWAALNAADSPLRGRVGFAPLPTVTGEPGWGALGGWQLAVNARVPTWRRRAAERLIAHLTSAPANLVLALSYGRNPARADVYANSRLRTGAPMIAELLPILQRARPRPVTPYYDLISDALQSEFSAAVTGLRTPAQALGRAQRQADRLVGATP
jgi:multiple sugar transport system substrate-binding protein